MPEPAGDLLLQRFSVLRAARPLLERLRNAGGVYLVGGAVRDLMLGTPPLDLDLVVDGELEPVAALLGTPQRVHDRFETCTVVLKGFRYDLARARRESYERPGALPTVAPAGIDEDLRRRDFTVNALALGLGGPERGRLVAVPGGVEDVRDRLLRVLHDASFSDDPTRLLRLARYATRLGFAVEEHTRALATAAVSAGAPATVTGSRLGMELRLLAAEPDAVGGFVALHELGVDAAIARGLGINDERARLARRALSLLPGDGEPADLVLAVAFLDVAAEQRAGLLDRLAFPAPRRDRILAAASRSRTLAQSLGEARRASEIDAVAGSGPVELVALAGAMGAEAGVQGAEAAARRWLDELRETRLEIDGDDLLAAGIAPGPAVGAGLAGARAAKLDGQTDGRGGELEAALRAAAAHTGRD